MKPLELICGLIVTLAAGLGAGYSIGNSIGNSNHPPSPPRANVAVSVATKVDKDVTCTPLLTDVGSAALSSAWCEKTVGTGAKSETQRFICWTSAAEPQLLCASPLAQAGAPAPAPAAVPPAPPAPPKAPAPAKH